MQGWVEPHPGGRRHPHLQADLRSLRRGRGLDRPAGVDARARAQRARAAGRSAPTRARPRFCAPCAGRDGHTRSRAGGSPCGSSSPSGSPACASIANNLVLLGLIGTIVGFIIALSGVDPDAVGDAAAIAPMVSTLMHGMAHGAVHDAGRLGAQRLADGQLPPARDRRHVTSSPSSSSRESAMQPCLTRTGRRRRRHRLPRPDHAGAERLRGARGPATAAAYRNPRPRRRPRTPSRRATSSSRRAGRTSSTPTSISGCRRRATCRSATPTRAARSSTCCATISAARADATEMNYEVSYSRAASRPASTRSTCISTATRRG